jgi:hypothetical protein
MTRKIIFLDVDGVLNSYRNVVADGGFPFPKGSGRDQDPRHREENLDRLAIGMIRRLCAEFDAQIVLHSTWRMHTDAVEFGKRVNLPIIGATDPQRAKPVSIRTWLAENPDVKNYLVIDDDNMEQPKRQIVTDIFEGFTYKNYIAAQKKLAYADGVFDKPLPE